MKITEKSILEHIAPLKDPEMQLGLVDLGLIYDVAISDDGIVDVKMTLTTPMCPIGPELMIMVKMAIEEIEEVKEAKVELVWDPPWNPQVMATDEVKDALGIW